MHQEAYEFVRLVGQPIGYGARILEFGSRNVNGSVRDLFRDSTFYCGIDIVPGDGVDVIACAAAYNHEQLVDVVICCEVLEHTILAGPICLNAWRNLRLGGRYIVTCAGPLRSPHSALDGGVLRRGEYYLNVTEEMLRAYLMCFDHSLVIVGRGGVDLYAVAIK